MWRTLLCLAVLAAVASASYTYSPIFPAVPEQFLTAGESIELRLTSYGTTVAECVCEDYDDDGSCAILELAVEGDYTCVVTGTFDVPDRVYKPYIRLRKITGFNGAFTSGQEVIINVLPDASMPPALVTNTKKGRRQYEVFSAVAGIETAFPFENAGGGAITSCSYVNTVLDGLHFVIEQSFERDTCVLKGTPLAFGDKKASYSFVVTAQNAAGQSEIDVVLKVAVELPVLRTSVDVPLYFQVDEEVELLFENVGGGEVLECVSDPPLPPSCTLRPTANGCILSGLATQPTPLTKYTIGAINAASHGPIPSTRTGAVEIEFAVAAVVPVVTVEGVQARALRVSWEAVPGAAAYMVSLLRNGNSEVLQVVDSAILSYDIVGHLPDFLGARIVVTVYFASAASEPVKAYVQVDGEMLRTAIGVFGPPEGSGDEVEMWGYSTRISADGTRFAGVLSNYNAGSSLYGKVYVYDQDPEDKSAWAVAHTIRTKDHRNVGQMDRPHAFAMSGTGKTVAIRVQVSTPSGVPTQYFVDTFDEVDGEFVYTDTLQSTEYSSYWNVIQLSNDGLMLVVGGTRANVNAAVGETMIVFIYSRSAVGQPWNVHGTVEVEGKPLDGTISRRSLGSISISDDNQRIVVGVPEYSGNTAGLDEAVSQPTAVSRTGIAYVLDFAPNQQQWQIAAHLQAPTVAANQYGATTAITHDGNTVAVGGNAYSAVDVFYFNGAGWTINETLNGPSINYQQRKFGRSVALTADGGKLAVGAPSDRSSEIGVATTDDGGPFLYTGAVYVYVREGNGWVTADYYLKPPGLEYSGLGQAVAYSADGKVLIAGNSDEEDGQIFMY